MHPFTLSIDDADSPWGGCTTHALFLILHELEGFVELSDYPLLVRLDPAVPRKTRGNAALVVRGYSSIPLEDLAAKAWSVLESYSFGRRPSEKRPGLALFASEKPWRIPGLRSFYLRAVREYIPARLAVEVARRYSVSYAGGSGVVGAIASLAALAPWDPYSFELIAYRDGGERCVKPDPRSESIVPNSCWGNYDHVAGPIAAPGGPDPVLAGFRGSRVDCLAVYERLLCSRPSGWIVFRSNQHTGVHTAAHIPIRPYASLRLVGRVVGKPRVIAGGHVIVQVEGGPPIAFYRETGRLSRIARMLEDGDYILVEATVIPRHGWLTLAAEALTVLRAQQRYVKVAPRCPKCGSRMKSAGHGKGYKCPKCGYRDPEARPLILWVPRRLIGGRVTSPPRSARHLTRFQEARPADKWPGLEKPLPASCFYSRGSKLPPIILGEC